MRVNEVPYARTDLRIPAAAGKDTIVADTRLHMVFLHVRLESGTEVVCCNRLAYCADIILLTRHRQQRSAMNRVRFDRPAAAR
jgi:hypothetical protein